MLAERGWVTTNMERAREIGIGAAVSSTSFIDLTKDDGKQGNLILEFQPLQSQSCEFQSPQFQSWRFESRRFQDMQENAMEDKSVQEKAMEDAFSTQRGGEITEPCMQEEFVRPYVNVKVEILGEEREDVGKTNIIDLDTYVDAEEQSEHKSLALVVVSDPPPQENVNRSTELAVVKVDNTETRESSSQSVSVDEQVRNGIISPTHPGELSVACQNPLGNGDVTPKAGVWDGPPRWTTSTVGILAVQCARCLKWRVVPSREKYEEIREHILETPWLCENAIEWRPDAHCELPTDLNQDSRSLWAIDKPNLPSSPPGWSRKVVVRRDCSTRFADVYYNAPDGKSLRSMVEVAKYLEENPRSVPQGTMLNQFSFTSPRPLPGVWVSARRKSRVRSMVNHSNSQECKKAKTSQPLAKQLAQKLLHGTIPPSLPVAPSFPSSSALPHVLPVGASFTEAPLGSDLEQFKAMQPPPVPPSPSFTNALNVPLFTSALPPMRYPSASSSVDSPSQTSQQASSFYPVQGRSTSDTGNPMAGSSLTALKMKQQQQQKSRLGGAIPMSQNANLPSILPLRSPTGGGVEVLHRC